MDSFVENFRCGPLESRAAEGSDARTQSAGPWHHRAAGLASDVNGRFLVVVAFLIERDHHVLLLTGGKGGDRTVTRSTSTAEPRGKRLSESRSTAARQAAT